MITITTVKFMAAVQHSKIQVPLEH